MKLANLMKGYAKDEMEERLGAVVLLC